MGTGSHVRVAFPSHLGSRTQHSRRRIGLGRGSDGNVSPLCRYRGRWKLFRLGSPANTAYDFTQPKQNVSLNIAASFCQSLRIRSLVDAPTPSDIKFMTWFRLWGEPFLPLCFERGANWLVSKTKIIIHLEKRRCHAALYRIWCSKCHTDVANSSIWTDVSALSDTKPL